MNPTNKSEDELVLTNNPKRKSPRAKFHDYCEGEYFVTICTKGKEPYFGRITDGKMHFSKVGKYCDEQLENIQKHYPDIKITHFIVMPNHVHAIIRIGEKHEQLNVSNKTLRRPTLSIVIGGIKRAVTLFARKYGINFGWQERYHDHIIRGTTDRNNIAHYIINNVTNWAQDCF